MAELIHQHGGNSIISKTAATMMGSTETTFYVIAVYFGAIGIKRTRHAIPAGLLADLAGIIVSVWICRYLFL
jgi:spore maturation protein B